MVKKKLTGIIVSDKSQKTVVVKVERIKEHPKYKRRYRVSKKYKAHCESDGYKVGDKIVIEECKPISKDKKWQVVEKLASSEKIIEPAIVDLAPEEEIKEVEKTEETKE